MLGEGLWPVYVICFFFGVVQILLVVASVVGFRSLAYIRGMLLPGLDPQSVEASRSQRRRSIKGVVTSEEESVTPDSAIVVPPFVNAMSINKKESGLLHEVFKLFGCARQPSKHEQLFGGFGSNGPRLYMHFIKCILLLSVVSIALLCVVLWEPVCQLKP